MHTNSWLAGAGHRNSIFAEVVSPKDGGPGMFAVVMEYIDGPEVNLRAGTPHHKAILKDAMDLLHNKGYVFGDLREPNLLLARTSFI